MRQAPALVPDYYDKFHCIGSDCEDTCCFGWTVHIDKKTFQFYRKNQHKELAPLFRQYVRRSEGSKNESDYAILHLDENRFCPFLDDKKLCRIQQAMGAAALSTVCRVYPRITNRFGGQNECSLSLSCPEAARRVLLEREPMRFSVKTMPDPATYTKILFSQPALAGSIAAFSDVRALSIAILQHRALSIDARLMLLGLFVEQLEKACEASPDDFSLVAADMGRVVAEFFAMLEHDTAIQAEFDRFPARPDMKLVLFIAVLRHFGTFTADTDDPRFRRAVSEAFAGLGFDQPPEKMAEVVSARYREAYLRWTKPFFAEHPHILENLLVHRVARMMFPFEEKGMLVQYHELACVHLISRIVLTGMAAARQGIDEAMVIRFFYAFNRVSDHNVHYTQRIVESLEEKNLTELSQFLLLLKEE